MLLLSYGKAGEACEPANEAILYRMSGYTEQERTVTCLVVKGLSDFIINQVITMIIRFNFRHTNL